MLNTFTRFKAWRIIKVLHKYWDASWKLMSGLGERLWAVAAEIKMNKTVVC